MYMRELSSFTLPLKSPIVCKTGGKGLWSEEIRETTIKSVVIKTGCVDFDFYNNMGVSIGVYIEAYFTKKDWNIDKHGLIYTDSNWLKDFNKGLTKQFPKLFWNNVDYTEQGMQGHNYVSLVHHLCSVKDINKFCDGLFGIDANWKSDNTY